MGHGRQGRDQSAGCVCARRRAERVGGQEVDKDVLKLSVARDSRRMFTIEIEGTGMTSKKTRERKPEATPLLLFPEAEADLTVAPAASTSPTTLSTAHPTPLGQPLVPPRGGQVEGLLDLLGGLNAAQRQAVTTTQGPLLILAGPGSGKTRVLTHRIAYLVASRGVDPAHILAVTFTNRAAREMRERLLALVGANAASAMAIGTFHAICLRMLRTSPAALPRYHLSPSFVICDTDEQLRVVREALKLVSPGGLPEQEQTPLNVLGRILRAKNALLGPDQVAEQAREYGDIVFARIYKAYAVLLRKHNAVDFDDLLWIAEHLLRSDDEVRRRFQRLWQYIHVDEFQDCNGTQYRLLRELSWGTEACHEGLGHLCVVGDDDQMIYSWRGASPAHLSRFTSDFPDAQRVLLEQNYRSTQVILDAAQAIVRLNGDRVAKTLWTDNGAGVKITVARAANEQGEGKYVAGEIARLRGRGDVGGWGDVAVMYRTNAQSRVLEEQFLLARIPYTVIGSRSFYERKEIKDMLAYLRLLANPQDELALERVINVPNRRIGPKTIASVRQWAAGRGVSLYDALAQVQACRLLGKGTRSTLAHFWQLCDSLRRLLEGYALPEVLDRVLEESGYGQELRALSTSPDERQSARWANVLELRRIAEEYTAMPTRDALEGLLQDVALMSGADAAPARRDDPSDAVTLITLHAAKGLEYPVVFIVGLDEELLPHAHALGQREQLEEERRLAYVGITRAMRRLYLVRAARRVVFGEIVEAAPSRFLANIPADLLHEKGT
jgi:DNA helicase-2/ATP-dependent DNA helicase PcrA